MDSTWLDSGCLYKRSTNCIAQMEASNTAAPLSDVHTVQAQLVSD